MSLQPCALVAAAVALVQVALGVGGLRCTVQQSLFSLAFDIAIQSSSADGGGSGSELAGVGLRKPRPFSHLGHEHFFFFFGWELSMLRIQNCQRSDLVDKPGVREYSV